MACHRATFNTYVASEGPKPTAEVVLQSLEMGAIPAAVMLIGSLVTILSPNPPPKVVAHALQHLAAGIMICAISMELVPPMARAQGRDSIIGLVLGFSMGVLVMIGLSIFLEEAEEDDDGEDSDPGAAESEALLSGELRDAAADGPGFRPVAGSRLAELRDSPRPGASTSGGDGPKSLVGQAYSLAGGRSESGSSAVADAVAGGHRGSGINGIREVRRPAFPWLFAFCVYVDSVMDGLLVGLALVTGNSAGVFMAAAMAVEMGFLGELCA
jgi:zinc transporter ZupT